MPLTPPKIDNLTRVSLLEQVGRAMGEAIALRQDAEFSLMVNGGCWECGKKYKRVVWLVKHMRAKHG